MRNMLEASIAILSALNTFEALPLTVLHEAFEEWTVAEVGRVLDGLVDLGFIRVWQTVHGDYLILRNSCAPA